MNNKIEIVQKLIDNYPKDVCALNYSSAYELLVAVILSAQCTDKRVNIVTEKLFKVANTPEKMITLGEDNLKRYIHSCGFYNSKAKSIISATKDILEKFEGEVPSTRKDLITLSGVGEKVASVVLSVWFKEPAIAVDTHVFRLSKRLGLVNEKTPDKTMYALEKLLPKEMWRDGHYAIVLHGREVCKAQKPNCENCFISKMCPKILEK